MANNSVNNQTDFNYITVVTTDTQIDVTQPVTNVVEVVAPGPKGDTGLSVPFESLGNGIWNTTSSIEITGSLAVSGTITGNITNAINSETASYSQTLGALLDNTTYGSLNEVFLLNSDNFPLSYVIVDNVSNAYNSYISQVTNEIYTIPIPDPNTEYFIVLKTGSLVSNYPYTSSFTYLPSTNTINVTSSYSQTSSFYQETDPVFVAKSASLATTGSNIFIGDQIITGSLIVSSSTSVLDTVNTVLKSSNGVSKLNWDTGDIRDSNNNTSIDWQNRGLKNASGAQTLYWNSGQLWDPAGGIDTLDWLNRKARATNGYYSLDWENRILTDKNGNTVLDWSEASLISINNLVSLTPQYSLPTTGISAGTFAVSASTPPKPYFWDGISWNALY